MAIPDLLDGLDHAIGTATPQDRAALIVALAARLAAIGGQMITAPTATTTTGTGTDRLLDMPEVAQLLGVPVDYAYTLARQRKIPTVRLPGLDKGGRARDGKYVRVRASVLIAWLKEHEDKGIDDGINAVLKSRHDRQRRATDPKGTRAVANRVRQAGGRLVCDREPMGDGGEPHPGADGQAHQATREVGQEGEMTWRS